MIIGLTGTICAGKSEVAKYLKSKGFECFVYSDILREEAAKRCIEQTRENLQKLGSSMKKEYGDGVLSKKILERVKTGKAVVDGVRTPCEVNELRRADDFFLIGVNAPPKVRYTRLRGRGRDGDPSSYEEFKRIDNLENRGKTEGQKINKCIKMADFLIINYGTLEDLKKKVDKMSEIFH
ncbi:dephospho-CoA kinase [Candidatus Woesearchaeota archaeon]|nr:dephospho-CoA kinase [Candidatus Woesearchaeota archaeon]